jgi:hypothetical protein
MLHLFNSPFSQNKKSLKSLLLTGARKEVECLSVQMALVKLVDQSKISPLHLSPNNFVK